MPECDTASVRIRIHCDSGAVLCTPPPSYLKRDTNRPTHNIVNLGSDHPSFLEAMARGIATPDSPDKRFPKMITCPNEVGVCDTGTLCRRDGRFFAERESA